MPTVIDRAHTRGRKPIGGAVWLSGCLEAKWIKRFRRTIVNKNKAGNIGAYQALVNPPLPWGNEADAPIEAPRIRAYRALSAEHRQKISESAKGRTAWNKGRRA